MPRSSVDGMAHTHHTIDYIELNVVDLAAAKTFYERAFGWAFNDYGPDYAGIRDPSGDGEVGGLGVGRPPGPGGRPTPRPPTSPSPEGSRIPAYSGP